MHEGILSLMQMAKTSAAIGRMRKAGILYVCVLTDPTMAGVYASWASLGDVIIAEPGAMIGFAGQRVYANTGSGMDASIQTSEYQAKCGMIDLVLPRGEIRPTVERLLAIAYATPAHGQ
jgi:acetyl-CoA carboxylase carboxyl transferase subunit beta